MDALLRQSPTVSLLAEGLDEDLFTLLDVGCGGGLMNGWRALGPHLRAFGFDPQRYEIARLRDAETNPLVEYVEGFVGVPDGHPLQALRAHDVYWSRSAWGRLAPMRSYAVEKGEPPVDPTRFETYLESMPAVAASPEGRPRALSPMAPEPRRQAAPRAAPVAIEAAEAERQFDLRERNQWPSADLASDDLQIVLPEFLVARGVTDVDFLKIDVDGPDYEILHTMSETLSDAQVLGVSLEVNFNGSHLPHHHTFHNMDRFMKAHGFALFGLDVRTYSSAALPQPYVMAHPAQSIRGRPLQGDALYVRDFGLKIPESDADQVSDQKLLKTAILFAMFDLPAEGVEHLQRFRERLSRLTDVDAAVESLTRESQRLETTHWNYKEYMAAFDRRDAFFFNRLIAPEYDPETGSGTHPITKAQSFANGEKALAVEARAEADALKAELAEIRASRIWRWRSAIRRWLPRGA